MRLQPSWSPILLQTDLTGGSYSSGSVCRKELVRTGSVHGKLLFAVEGGRAGLA